MDATIQIRNNQKFLVHIYIISSAICLLITSLMIINAPFYKTMIFAGTSASMIAGALITRHLGRLKFMAHAYNVICYIAILVYATHTGGLVAPGMIWLMICPFISYIVLSRQVAIFWLVMDLIALLILALLKDSVVFDTYEGGDGWYFISYTLFLLTIFQINGAFYRIIEGKSKQLKELNLKLQNSQLQLLEYQNEIKMQNELLHEQRQQAILRSDRLKKLLDEMIEISRMEELHFGNLDETRQILSRTLLNSLDLDRVSIWHFNADKDELFRLVTVASNSSISYEKVDVISRLQCPKAMKFFEEGMAIKVGDTDGSPFVEELVALSGENYAFKSLIVNPYFFEGRLAGVILCESLRPRHWDTEEVIFLRAMADTLSLTYKSYERQLQKEALEEKQQYIQEINQHLELKVSRRTADLQLINNRLLEYANLNAHEIRGPICRLLGLKNLLGFTTSTKQVQQIVRYMTDSIDELDDITIRAGRLLEDQYMTEHKIESNA